MPNVYVVGAMIPRGGTFMAYHVGLILQQEFGYTMVDVRVDEKVEESPFDYALTPESITLPELEKRVTKDDLILVNPSFSRFMLGFRLPGRKISYVQGFQTFPVLDCRLDLYVSVSSIVQGYLQSVWGIGTDVIPAFVQFDALPQPRPWYVRPEHTALMCVKEGRENQMAARFLQNQIKARVPQLQLDVVKPAGLPHGEFMRRIADARYFINVSLAEGFGLVALEAMALGTVVCGFDGLAGKDYLKFGKNSMAHPPREIDKIAGSVAKLAGDAALCQSLSEQGIKDAKAYGYPAFKRAWVSVLREFLAPA